MSTPSTVGRQRASSTITNQITTDLQRCLDSLQACAPEKDILGRLQWLSLIHRTLNGSTDAKDIFRRLRGFNYIMESLMSVAGFYANEVTEEDKRHFFEFMKALFSVLSEALVDHPGNRRWFWRKVGPDALQMGLAASGMPISARDELFGLLFGFAMDDATLASLFNILRNEVKRTNGGAAKSVQLKVKGMFAAKDVLQNPEVVPIIVDFYNALAREKNDYDLVCIAVLQALLSIASASKVNLTSMHETGIMSSLLRRLWDDSLPEYERPVAVDLVRTLVKLGVNDLEDAKFLYGKAYENDKIAAFLLESIKASRTPAHIQFDTSLHGYSALEMSSMGRPFPPSSPGYTFAAWIYIDKLDSSMHTTIFGIFDKTQKCFVLAYIEKDTHRFILQTSLSSSQASVRFRSINFKEKRWYHIAVAHRKGKMTMASKAAFFVNGEFVEEVKCQYPHQPPPNENCQIFLGIPVALSIRIGKGVVSTSWSCASFHLFEDILSDDIVAVFYRLGPRYHGNFQDSLGAFQTFEASAALNMRNELMHPGKEEKSDIVTVIRTRASTILHEQKLLVSISPLSVFKDDTGTSNRVNVLVKGLTKQSSRNLNAMTRNTALSINAAVPNINEALCTSNGVGILTGGPVLFIPQGLDEASWRIGGCASVCLKLVELAETPDQICMATSILFESVRENWRNSEAMERDNGFGILAHLLRNKEAKGVIGQKLLHIILEFVGFKRKALEESIIINPLAYRILLVDFDLWRKADLETLKEYFNQFVVFCQGSKYHHFNGKKLVKMRVVKKWLFALKSEIFSSEVLPHFMTAFKVVVQVNMGAEVMRSLALSITYSLHKGNPLKALKGKKSTTSLRPVTTPNGDNRPTSSASHQSSIFETNRENAQNIGLLLLEVYTSWLCDDPSNTTIIKKFARTVTNKWLLYLLAENDQRVVLLAIRILSRLLVVHGSSYITKFAQPSNGGFTIMRNRLKRWWHTTTSWWVCFGILFGVDTAKIDMTQSFNKDNLIDVFFPNGKLQIVYPEIFVVIGTMLKAGVSAVVVEGGVPKPSKYGIHESGALSLPNVSRLRSKSVNEAGGNVPEPFGENATRLLRSVVDFFAYLHEKSPQFRDFATGSQFAQELFSVLFPVVCSSDTVSAETELNSKDSALTFDGGDVVIRPLNGSNTSLTPIVRTVVVDDHESPPIDGPRPPNQRSERLRRGSSFILVTAERPLYKPTSAKISSNVASPIIETMPELFDPTNSVVESLMDLVVSVFVDAILERREFNGFKAFNLIPPGFQEHQIYFESYLLRNTLSKLTTILASNLVKLCDTKVLTNMGRFLNHMADYVYDGVFLHGAESLIDFTGLVLEYLQRPEVVKQKSVRLCSGVVAHIRTTMSRLVMFRLAEMEDNGDDAEAIIEFFNKIMYWQAVILSPENSDGDFMKLICYLLYTRLMDNRHQVRLAATNIFRIVLVQKPSETAILLNQAETEEPKRLSTGFQKLMEMDNETFVDWADEHKYELDAFFYGALSKTWEIFVSDENRKIDERKKARSQRRKDKLKEWVTEDLSAEDIYDRHTSATNHWMANIYAEEHLRHQRAIQDKQDTTTFLLSLYERLDADLKRYGGLMDLKTKTGWRLDLTEGRNRMRKRLLPDAKSHLHNYQPKRRPGDGGSNTISRPNVKHALSVDDDEISIISRRDTNPTPEPGVSTRDGADDDFDDFEIVEDPRGNDEDRYEDKNRKVLRSLQHGDMVEDVHNISRLTGLEACEGLLIVGKYHLYLIDNFFMRTDMEIVNVWQAPPEDRDQYLQMIAGTNVKSASMDKPPSELSHDSRHWSWEDLISISKRQFLFRDVGLELFFADGRSYLLITSNQNARNKLHAKLLSKATSVGNHQQSTHAEEAWRIEALQSPNTSSFNIGSKIANVFSSSTQNPATRRWLRGEISNFHYLMLVNTMAGRTFNDLTQYPVFPWVIADYTSEELDLTNPRTFRDLSKPMGAQTPERQREFRERYRAYEEMGDGSSPAFHYGTHYSSAMIVCSYLIRLQPFVQSYLLLQGGQFDHADRLFYSIEKAWASASRDNMTDVRELIPEFYFLPEFLVNANGYNFGNKQGTGEAIDGVQLPPWAKGDPKIFIAKQREALESPYVSKHLHEWIDLVFGFKQRGEAAIEATNVFHHLSYRGAIDLDTIEDKVEQLATVGIVYNFGQTPHQVFNRPHPMRDLNTKKPVRLDTGVEHLIRLPFPVAECKEPVSSLTWSTKQEKVIYSSPTKLNVPPHGEKLLDWGFVDGSIRIYNSEPRKQFTLFEHPHQGPLSCAIFYDASTLITAGADCVITVWKLSLNPKHPELNHRTSFFGHVQPVNMMAVSRSFSTLVTSSTDREVLIWDLNRLQFIRPLALPIATSPVECIAINDVNGEILVCHGQIVSVYTINGELIVSQSVCEKQDDIVMSCAFYEGVGNEWLERDLIFTGHKRGVAKVWNKTVGRNGWELHCIKTLQHVNQFQGDQVVQVGITAILPLSNAVHTADEMGRVYEWDCQTVERK